MDRSSKVALGCAGFLVVAALAGFWGWWSAVRGHGMTGDGLEVRARTEALLPGFAPPEPLAPIFARRMARAADSDAAVVWAVDSRYRNLMFVARAAPAEPASPEALLEALTTVHPGLAGFDPETTEPPRTVRVRGAERPALVQSARTVDEDRQVRSCVAFPSGGRWIYLMLQGDAADAGPEALQRILDAVPAEARAG